MDSGTILLTVYLSSLGLSFFILVISVTRAHFFTKSTALKSIVTAVTLYAACDNILNAYSLINITIVVCSPMLLGALVLSASSHSAESKTPWITFATYLSAFIGFVFVFILLTHWTLLMRSPHCLG